MIAYKAVVPLFYYEKLGINIDINLLEEGILEYIVICIPSYTIASSCKRKYYYRSGSINQKLTGLELENFILSKRGDS